MTLEPYLNNRDCLHLIFTYLDAVDLLTATQVNALWRDVAVYHMSKIRKLKCSDVRRAFKIRKCKFSQEDFEDLVKFSGPGLQTLDLRSAFHADSDVFQDFGKLMHTITQHCSSITELYIPSKSYLPDDVIFPRSLRKVDLFGCVSENALQSMGRGCPELESISLHGNRAATGDFFPQSLADNPMKSIELGRCSNIASPIIHFILKSYSTTLESLSITDHTPSREVYFDTSDLNVLQKLNSLKIGSWFDRQNFRYQSVERILAFTPGLTSLTVRYCWNLHERPDCIYSLTRACRGLATLDLTGCTLPPARFLIPLTYLKSLKKLVLARTSISPSYQDPIPDDGAENNVQMPLDDIEVDNEREGEGEDGNIIPDNIIPDNNVPDNNIVPDNNNVPDNIIPVNIVPDNNVPDNIVPDNIVPDNSKMNFLIYSVLTKIPTLQILHIGDYGDDLLTDNHIVCLILDLEDLREVYISPGCGIFGTFLEKCSGVAKDRQVQVSVVTKKWCQNGDALYRRSVSCPSNNVVVSVHWEH